VGDLGRQRGRLHETKNQRAILEPVTAFAATAYKPEDVLEYVNRAFAVFDSRRPRPVYIEIPLDVLAAPVSGEWYPRQLSVRPGPRPQDIDKAVALIAGASRPAIICGGGAWEAAAEIRSLAEHLSIPVLSTIAGKGLLPAGHELQLDALLHLPTARKFIADCDVVLAIGTELAQSEFLTSQPLTVNGEMIRIDIDHEQLCDEQPTTLPILSDARIAMQAIWNGVRGRPASKTAKRGAERAEALRVTVRDQLPDMERLYIRALETIASGLPGNSMIFTDMTTIAYTGNFTYPVQKGGRWFHPAGYGSLGYGLPAAIGAKIADSTRPVIAIVGDGGFQFTLPELAVIAELELPILIILWNNGCFGQIKKGMQARNVSLVGVDYALPNLCGIAEAYGIGAHIPTSVEEARDTVRSVIASAKPAIIELTPGIFA
jgi:5-guanidino-2-oxopentanoate decarboxylase